MEKIREHGECKISGEWKNPGELEPWRVFLVMGEPKLFDTKKSVFHKGILNQEFSLVKASKDVISQCEIKK